MTRKKNEARAASLALSVSNKQSVAHKLLIELLSYQFAFPVRWIETQNAVFDRDQTIQRYVEIGPNRVLANMAKKTVEQQFGARDKSRSIQRKFLSSGDDAKDIFYHYEENESDKQESADEVQATSKPDIPSATPSTQPSIPTTPAAKSPTPPSTNSAPAQQVSDTPLSAKDIILALTAQKLKKPFDQVPVEKSIRELSGGKSTLQNELIGDLGAELGNLPDGSEDLTLAALGESVASTFSGQPGKQISTLISKLISSKMPGGFNQQAIRQYLSSNWGLGPQRQTAVICFSISAEPPSRLANTEAAKEFFDSVVQRYGIFSGIALSAGASNSQTSAAQPTMIDAASLDLATKEYKDTLAKIHYVLSNFLGVDGGAAGEDAAAALEASKKRLSEKLEHWNAEFGDEISTGTIPIFDARKERFYDSWWNWVKVDLISFIQDLQLQPGDGHILPDVESRRQQILNRWTPECAQITKFFSIDSNENLPLKLNLQMLLEIGTSTLNRPPTFKFTNLVKAPKTTIDPSGRIVYTEVLRGSSHNRSDYAGVVSAGSWDPSTQQNLPFIHLKSRQGQDWKYNREWTGILLESLAVGVTSGLTFAGKVMLVTGAGPGSIGSEIVRGLLEGGAEVLVTTSRVPSSTAKFYSEMYKSHGSKGSKLIVLPFNQGSKQDCEALINHIYTNKSGYGGDLDIIIPFAAIGDSGQLDNLGSKSELAHRLMLTNLLRLLGYVKQHKAQRNLNSRPTNVILPLSPNHGTFGGDGLYSESKLGLETLFNRFYSEGWSTYLTICGAVIGWTRGTGLMSANNMLAEEVESHNTLTFSQSEMAFNILALAIPAIASICEDEPVYADLGGNLQSVPDLKAILSSARKTFSKQSKIRKALVAENLHEQNLLGAHLATESNKQPPRRRANLQVGYPSLSDYKTTTANVPDLSGMVDLKRTIVVVGFSDLSPWGSSRTRWEMEHKSDLTLEGYIEMAWIMGLIKHFNGEVKGEPFVGWIDSKTKEPVHDDEMKEKYGKTIMEHSGIRFIEPKLFDGYDPEKKEFLHEVVVEEDLPPFEVSKATAEAFKLRHGDKASISAIPGSESAEYKVQIKKGAHFMVAKAVPFSRLVAGQLPSGFDPVNYGIPEDIVSQVDPITIYVLCCVCQALLSAGIQDPYEVYKHIHVSELANCIGTGVGGLKAMRGVYRDRYLDRPVQSDILQESYLNVMGAWTNMLLLASAGPIKSPVGTCATAVESMDSGCESILLGKAKMAFVGGTDDFQEEMSYEFANMKATSNTHDELAKGRLPSEMSRPGTTTRSGFMESAGCGIQIIMNAELALEMGLPIYAVLAHTQMAGDRVGRSVPAPGQGVLTAARESVGAAHSPLLNLEYRRRNLNETVQAIQMWHTKELLHARQMPGDITKIVKSIEATSECRIRDARNLWGNDFRKQDPEISPMRAALGVWGLTVDDIQVASLHGTSTKANDTNESDVINKQMNKLGRSKGNPVLAISQKYLTGHPKGAAGAWMFNGCLQVLQTGIVPGNRNADNIDVSFQQYEHVLYPSHTIQTSGIKAFMLTSFGFGQKGGIAIAIAPNYLFAAITEERFNHYRARVLPRQEKANRTFITGIMTNSIFKAKDHSPWKKEDETKVFLDPLARVSSNTLTNEIAFDGKNLHPVTTAVDASPKAQDTALNEQLNFLNHISKQFLDTNATASTTGVGVDVENISCINFENAIFVERNFTSEEKAYAECSPNPQAAFAGRWSAKEAVFKSLGVQSKGAGAAMNDIEVWSDGGVPMIKLHGEVAQIAKAKGISDFKISISHCPDTVMAVAVAVKSQGAEGCGGCAESKGFSF